jgi:hypothetical protein
MTKTMGSGVRKGIKKREKVPVLFINNKSFYKK